MARLIGVLAAVAAGCGHPSASVPAASAGLDQATVICDHAIRCGTIGASQRTACESPARQLALVWGAPDLQGIDALVASGHLRRDPDDLQRCLAQLASASCRDRSASCELGMDPIAPSVATGGACTRSDECIEGLCTAQPGCEGTCAARSQVSGPCGPDQVCTASAYCVEGTCHKRGAAGEPCNGDGQSCGDRLFCAGYHAPIEDTHYMSPEVLGTCHALLDVGDSCVGQDHCRTGLTCAWGDPAPTCQPPLATGAACRWPDACGDGLACVGLSLHGIARGHAHFAVAQPGTCAPMLDAGSPCDPTAFTTGCPQSMRCDRAAKRCRSTGHAGDPCDSVWLTKPTPSDEPIDNESCFSGLYCDVATRTCKRQLVPGAACTPTTLGVEDDPCFVAKCDPVFHRCVTACK